MLMNYYEKSIIIALLLFPFFSYASFTKDLYYGVRGDAEVQALQEFLADQGQYTGAASGNFFSLTLSAVKKFQIANNISPASGYFGPKTRAKANQILETAGVSTDSVKNEDNAPVSAPVVAPKTANDVVASLASQIVLLQQQLATLQKNQDALQQQNQSLQAIQQQQAAQTQQITQQTQTLQQIQTNTTPPPLPPPAPEPSPTVINASFTSKVGDATYLSAIANHKITFKKIRYALSDYDADDPNFQIPVVSMTDVETNSQGQITNRGVEANRPATLTNKGGYVDFALPEGFTPPFRFSVGIGCVDYSTGSPCMTYIMSIPGRSFVGLIYSYKATIKADGTEIVDEFGRSVTLPQDYSATLIFHQRNSQ